MLPDARFNFASNSHRTSLKLNESQQLEREILRNYNLELSTFMAPIVKLYHHTLKTANTHLKLFVTLISLAKTNFFSLWILHLFIVSFAILSLKNFFDPLTVKKPISETTPLSQTSANNSFQLKLSNIVPIPLPLYLPWVTKRESLLTISIQYQA